MSFVPNSDSIADLKACSGDQVCIDELNSLMDRKNIFARKLPVSVAYHSSYMEEIATEYSFLIRDLWPRNNIPLPKGEYPTTAIFSSVTGREIAPEVLCTSDYWVTNLVSKVRFSDALSELSNYILERRQKSKTGKDLLVEVGPHTALQRPIKVCDSLMLYLDNSHHIAMEAPLWSTLSLQFGSTGSATPLCEPSNSIRLTERL